MKDFHASPEAGGFSAKTIRITVPAKIASSLGEMNKVTEYVLNELGCPGCHSGFDLRFDIERHYLFNEQLEMVNRY